MKKRIKRIVTFALATTLAMSILTSCGQKLEPIVPEKQIFVDKFKRNEDITNYMTYTPDYMASSGSLFNDMNVVPLFDHIKVQVDNWESVVVGGTTMGELTKTIDKANKDYVDLKTQEVIDKRQKEIDKEYENAKKKAKEKGREYNKEKKEVRTDDIHFDEPYSYSVKLGGDQAKETSKYEPTLLVDPKTYSSINLEVSKYDIPYAKFEFVSLRGLYNDEIKQESSWVLNGVSAANTINQEAQTKKDKKEEEPKEKEYVDVDGLNKAAKKNMFMSGNIAFSGEGFKWDTLMDLCKALNLKEGENKGGFQQSSDEKFTYYTLTMHANPFELQPNIIGDEKIQVPIIRLVATFDTLSQVCVNWRVDTHSNSATLNSEKHDLGEKTKVDVHNFKVDTTDYKGMKEKLTNWIEANAEDTTTSYCALDPSKDKLFGIVDTGLQNATIEPIIDGTPYVALHSQENEDGTISGLYISKEEAKKSEKMKDGEEYISKHSKDLLIDVCILDKDKNILSHMSDDTISYTRKNNNYYIVDYEKSDKGYKNIKVLNEQKASELLVQYVKIFELSAEENKEIQAIAKEQGFYKVKEHVLGKFKEEDKKGETPKTLAEGIKENTKEDISVFTLNDKKRDVDDLTLENFSDKVGYQSLNQPFNDKSDAFHAKGTLYQHKNGRQIGVLDSKDKFGVYAKEKDTLFYKGIKVGMKKKEVLDAIGEKIEPTSDGSIILKNKTHLLVIKFTLTDEVSHIILTQR